MIDFVGPGQPLSQAGFDGAVAALQADPASLWAVLAVETSGCGFLPDRRPKILFERHIFSRLTNGQFDADDPDVSAPTPGGYGPGGANQYTRLEVAIQLDQDAALQSASWGLGQIMGMNHQAAGYAAALDMVTAFVASEDNQLQGMAQFISASAMAPTLRGHDWAGFARRYNGPNYAKNNYNGQLQQFYARYSTGAPPDLTVRAAQVYLTYLGFSPGGIDGIAGPNTIAAVRAFQTSAGLAVTGVVDAALIQRLAV
jgi:hypothetical protein